MTPVRGALLLLLLLAPACVAAQDLTLRDRGHDVGTLSLARMQSEIGERIIEVHEPHDPSSVRYAGFRLDALLDAVYGADWRNRGELLVSCEDGYQPAIPVADLLRFEAWLVHRRADDAAFRLHNVRQGETVDLGPFYLVWNNLDAPELQQEGAAAWPYQVVALDLIEFSDRFPRMAPPTDAAAEVRQGFLAFRKYCMSCHTINGEGGAKAVELNYPVSVTEYFDEHWLRRWIDAPRSMRYDTSMPPLVYDGQDRPAMIDAIVAYLKVMATRKQAPAVQEN